MSAMIRSQVARYASLLTGVCISIQERLKALSEGNISTDIKDVVVNLTQMLSLLSDTRKEVKAIMRALRENKK